MMSLPMLVLDANILIRAVLGSTVRKYLIEFNDSVNFFTPDICVEDAKQYLPLIFEKRGLPSNAAVKTFLQVQGLLQIIDENIYQERAAEAKKRISHRDIDDWPVVATALLFNCPIWTEDKDFFGVGIPVWTTGQIHHFFDSI